MNDSDQSKAEEWDLVGHASGGEEDERRLAHEFVARFQEEKIHPVLIFGTSLSGKTLMILSLLQYAKHNARADMTIRLGDPVFPPKFLWAVDRYGDAEQFYNNLTAEFARGDRPPSTQKVAPFFIPINIEVAGKTYKLAFLEGMGEWYERDETGYKQFKQEIVLLLSGLAAPMSVIFVAPTRNEATRNDRIFWSSPHDCLANCVEQYDKHRLVRDRDNLLLLLSKWDALRDPGRIDSHFSDASIAEVLSDIRDWPNIWQQFANLKGPNRALTPYSASWINPGGQIVRDIRYQPIFDKFNRTLWNWLFGNVTAVRGILYDDVQPPKPRAPSFYQSLVKASLWI
jgi:hypothetical protein